MALTKIPASFIDTSSGITGDTTVTGNFTVTGYLAGPSTFTIDPAGVGDNTGTVVIAGNLQVDGTTTTINSTTMEVDDLNITLASGAANAAAANGAGITIDGASATLTYNSTPDAWSFNKNVGIGTTEVSAFYSGGRQLVVGSGSGQQGITIYAGAANDSGIYFADGTTGSDIYKGQLTYNHSSNAFVFYTNVTAHMWLTNDGKLGIGTAAPSYRLHIVSDDADSGLKITKTGAETVRLAVDSVGSYIYNQGSYPFRIYTGGAENLYLDSTGKFGLGTLNPQSRLHMAGSVALLNVIDDWQQGSAGTHLLRAGTFANTISNDTTALKIFPATSDSRPIGDYHTGISFMALDPDNSTWGNTYTGAQGWIGLRVVDNSGQERSSLVFATNNSTSNGSHPVERLSITQAGEIRLDAGSVQRPILRSSYWGYGSSYRAAVLGSTSTTYNTAGTGSITLSFNYDPSGNSNSSFSGDGREILFRRGTQFVTPNSDDTAFYNYNLTLIDGKVGIGNSNPSANLHISKSYDSLERALIVSAGNEQTGARYDTIVVNQPDVPCIRLIETDNNQELTLAVGNENGNNAMIGATGQLSFGAGRGASAQGYAIPTNGIALNISSSNYVTTPLIPAFAARGLSNSSTSSYVNPVPQVLTWTNVTVNNGSHFNSSTGRFTAPIAGRYYFFLSFLVDDSATAGEVSRVQILKNGSATGHKAYVQDTSSSYYQGMQATAVVLSMSANDYVEFYGDSGKIHVGSETQCCGYLIG
jgi:hypothetical protein